MSSRPILHLIAGVNGAGKTSFYRYQLESETGGVEFVNADDLARETWPGCEEQHVPEAARLAARRRMELLDEGKTFVAETVFSHESKLDLVAEAKRRGFSVILYHVHVNSAELARARIRTRVSQGGHAVPDAKVEARFERSLALIPRAAELADITLVFDNSGDGGARTHRHVMTLHRGRVSVLRDELPDWAGRAYREAISRFRAGGR